MLTSSGEAVDEDVVHAHVAHQGVALSHVCGQQVGWHKLRGDEFAEGPREACLGA